MKEYRSQHMTLRMPPPLRVWVAEQAARNCRSVNQEIVDRLTRTRWLDDPQSRPPEWQAGAPAAGEASRA